MTATTSAATGFEPLDPAIREQYDRDGYVVIPNALAEEDRAYFEGAVDRIYAEEEAAGELRPDRSIHVMGWMHRDPRFVELLHWRNVGVDSAANPFCGDDDFGRRTILIRLFSNIA